MNRMMAGALALMAGVAAQPAAAATVIVTHVVDPASLSGDLVQDMLTSPVMLGGGDTLDLTIRFTGNQRLRITGDTYLWPVVVIAPGQGDATLPVSGAMTFLGGGGDLVIGPVPLLGVSAFSHAGLRVGAPAYRTGTGEISFSGIRQVLDIGHVVPPGSRLFDRIGLVTDGLVIASPAPEPGSWALMLAGFLGVGALLRRRRSMLPALARQRPSG